MPAGLPDGLIDLQVNGYAGVDFNDAGLTETALDHALGAMRADGVAARLRALDRAVAANRLGAAMVPGYHLEGPFLSPEPGYAGCHPAAFMRPADPALVARLEEGLARPILLITLAPEREGGLALNRWAVGRGKIVAHGHTAADPATIAAAVAAGARLATHLGNALASPQPKFANPMLAQLSEDALAASFIADGIHVPPFALRVMLRAKTVARSILVSDATAAAGAGPGLYRLGDLTIERGADGAVRLPGTDRLAGSTLVLADAVRNLVAWGLASEAEATRMAAANPAALLAPALAAHGLRLP